MVMAVVVTAGITGYILIALLVGAWLIRLWGDSMGEPQYGLGVTYAVFWPLTVPIVGGGWLLMQGIKAVCKLLRVVPE